MRNVVYTCQSCGQMYEGDGASRVCPSCSTISVAPAFVFPEPEIPRRRRRWWNDPVIIVGAAVPLLILAAFAWYVAPARRQPPPAPAPAPLSTLDLERMEAEVLPIFFAAADRLEADHSPAAFAAFRKAKETLTAVRRAIWGPHADLIAEADALFLEPADEIGWMARDEARMLMKDGIEADPVEVVEGGVFLRKHTHDPNPAEPPSFQSYRFLYSRWRKDGLSHRQAIDRMHELRKF